MSDIVISYIQKVKIFIFNNFFFLKRCVFIFQKHISFFFIYRVVFQRACRPGSRMKPAARHDGCAASPRGFDT